MSTRYGTTLAADPAAIVEDALSEAGISMDVNRFLQLVGEALKTVRLQRAVVDARSQLTRAELVELRRGGLAVTSDLSASQRARGRTAAETAALLTTALTTAQAAQRLGVDASRIRQLLAGRELLAIKEGGEWRILELQFADGRLVPNISVVVRALPPRLPLLAAANWLRTPEPDLEFEGQPLSPIEWLSAGGDPERARALAAEL